jgi:hypothetical protein
VETAKGPDSGPASLQAASPAGEGEALAAVAGPPPSREALAGAFLALFNAGDLGKKLYRVLCRDIAMVGEPNRLVGPSAYRHRIHRAAPAGGKPGGEGREEARPTGPSGQSAGASAAPGPASPGARRRGERRGRCGGARFQGV